MSASPATRSGLPIDEILDEVKRQFKQTDQVVLEAPPGAGKTTIVPLALIAEPWLRDRKILVLEPRRIAARSAAIRMSALMDEPVGETIGYRMRLETRVSKSTKVEVITEGILTRMLQQDPSLEQAGLVVFDEFHERNLDSDLALALCLKGRSIFRDSDPLKLLVMSATLDSKKIAELIHAPVITSEGKLFPVEVIYTGASKPRDRIVDRILITIRTALKDNPQSSMLVFLPGQGEIGRVRDALTNLPVGLEVHCLYGNLSLAEQQSAIAPAGKGVRKIVLATNIAETSLTIEAIDVVIDSGLAREARFDPATGMTRLHTVKISRSSATQRLGRAGRLRPGRCYRLWSEDQQQQLALQSTPEILHADLAPFALQLLHWGVSHPSELDWMDPPSNGQWQTSMALLRQLGAVRPVQEHTSTPGLTAIGEAMAILPTHPRIAHLLICSKAISVVNTACLMAAALSDRDPFQEHTDISYRIEILTGERSCPRQHRGWLQRTRDLARQFEQQISQIPVEESSFTVLRSQLEGYLLACAYPDRIARKRHSGGYQLANGRSANLAGSQSLGKHRWLAVAAVGGLAHSKGDTIRSAACLDEELFGNALAHLKTEHTVAQWEDKSKRFIAEERASIGKHVITRKTLLAVPVEIKNAALISHVRDANLGTLTWTPDLRQWQARVSLVGNTLNKPHWPQVDDDYLRDQLEQWLAPFLDPVTTLGDIRKLDLASILESLLTWDEQTELKTLAPTRLKVPSGSNILIDYQHSPPILAVKLQEMFGCEETPRLVANEVAVVVHLLSPAGRPIQITQDLAGFWRSSYHQVRKEMKGRYPKHPWPDDPLQALPTRRTKVQ
ncbi:MAG TPA: ATP-dependent helicase HrpB [Gammaproteobacteria bacterium]|nr:ATP-dependent helicase HrpB [Gammaproteobacteria bacterium]HIL95864.1 ATP-dependent helicase HrpB [Pseudomonadales bacterium]